MTEHPPLRVALTGGIASGKSRCAAVFRAAGVPVIDADSVARDVVAPGSAGLAAIATRFGPSVLAADGSLDRDALGALVFADDAARRDLEAIVHPRVYDAIHTWFQEQTAPLAIADIPLLFETGRHGDFDRVVVAACRPEQQLARLMARNGLSEAAARARLAAQWPIGDKVALADFVIDTSGTLDETDARAASVLDELRRGLQQP
ncbi:MAG: dephospho-CoA kinase [Vicinamibacterales bacterium]